MAVNEEKKEEKEKRTFFQWINFFIPYVYTTGIFVIVLWMLTSSIILVTKVIEKDPMQLFLQPNNTDKQSPSQISKAEINPENPKQNTELSITQSKNPWFDVVIKPIVEPKFNQIIFKGVFLLLIWMLFFLVIPVAFKRLKKFKLLNMEFEVEGIEKAAIETIEISGSKAKLMAYLSGEDASGKTIRLLDESVVDFCEVLTYFLEEIRLGYKNSFNASFSYSIHINEIPSKYEEMASESLESNEAVTQNKIDNENLFKQNSLVFYFSSNNNNYVTVLTSYTYQFDVLDKYLVQLLHNTVSKNIENIEYMIELTEPFESDPA